MTKKGFWREFLNQNIAIYAPSQNAYNLLMRFFHYKGLRWINGADAVDGRRISNKGIYIMATQEEDDIKVLVCEEMKENILNDVATVSTYYVLGNLFRNDSIDDQAREENMRC